MRKKFHSMIEDKSSEEEEVVKKKKHRTPLHVPYHGTSGKSLISGDTESHVEKTTALTTTTPPSTTLATTPTTTTGNTIF